MLLNVNHRKGKFCKKKVSKTEFNVNVDASYVMIIMDEIYLFHALLKQNHVICSYTQKQKVLQGCKFPC